MAERSSAFAKDPKEPADLIDGAAWSGRDGVEIHKSLLGVPAPTKPPPMRFVVLPLTFAIASFAACGGSDASNADSTAGTGSGTDGGKTSATSDGGGTTATTDSDSGTTTKDDGGTSTKDSGVPTTSNVSKIKHIFTVLFENHDYAEVIGSSDAPYFNSLANQYALATNYNDSGVHPSLPNYLVMISGAPQYPGIIDVNPTTFPFPVKQPHLGTQMQAKSIKWRSYQESAGGNCKKSSSGEYAPKHDPFLYFDDIQNGANDLCATTNVEYTALAADMAAGTYTYSFVTPNLTNDGHDPSNDPSTGTKNSDAWAATEIPKIMASAAYKDGGVIFITWDEAEGRSGHSASQIPMIVVSDLLKSKGLKVATKYSHKSYLATIEDILGLPRLDTVKSEPSMLEFFQ